MNKSDSVTQLFRPAAFHCPIGENVLVLSTMSGQEEISRPFRYEVELISQDPEINLDKLIGQPGAVRLALGATKGGSRHFHGVISRCRQLPTVDRYGRYRVEIVPWLWLLTLTSDCRIFQNLTVPQILEDVFRRHGFTDYELRLTGIYQPKEYCVQYRETGFSFVSRLMEQEGICYFFRHTAERHYLVLADSQAAHKAFPGYDEIAWLPHSQGGTATQKIREWIVEKELQPGAYAQRDYDFKKPRATLATQYDLLRPHALNSFEIYNYPGEYEQTDEGENYTRVRLEELQTRYEVVSGLSDARGLAIGHTFHLTNYPREDQNRACLVLSVRHRINVTEYASGEQTGSGKPLYECDFTVMEAAQPFRPPRLTPKPIVQGPQTAKVVGREGQEVDVDKYGRVKVHFHWDRHDQQDENSSCWIRVSHPWAGKGFGGMAIPRLGQEVIVEFLEGDPDRPIINGRIYNADTMPHSSNAGRKMGGPADLSQAAMMTSFKSNSFGGSGGHNEITMNDTGGAEGLFIKAQRDEIHLVGNDQANKIGNNRSTEVGVDSGEKIGNNSGLEVGANSKETVGAAKSIAVGTNLLITAGTSITLQCGAGSIHMNQAGLISITGTIVLVGGAITTDITAPITTISGLALLQTGVVSVNAGVFTNIVGGVTVIDGNPVKIN